MPANCEVSANASGSGAFYRIPNEILALIVGHLGNEGARDRIWHDFSLLKALRLTHQRFADLGFINAILFYDVHLEATRTGLARIRRSDLSRIGDYVHTVTFITPLSWALPFEVFSGIVTHEALTQRVSEAGDKMTTSFLFSAMFDSKSQEEYVNEYFGRQWPLSEAQLRDGFAAYMREADAAKALLEDPDGELTEAWVNVLRKLEGNVRKVHFRSLRCERDPGDYTPSDDPEPLCRLGPHKHPTSCYGQFEYGCDRASAVAGDVVFARAMSCLATSGTKVRELSIRHNATGEYAWEAIPNWEKLDLSSLEELEFPPRTPMASPLYLAKSLHELLPSPKGEEVLPRAQEALHALIKKCHGSLRKLSIRGAPASWPDRPPANLDMPALEHLDLGETHPTLLGEWMACMPRLRYLEMRNSFIPEGVSIAALADVFDAVRDHPNVAAPDAPGMEVDLDYIFRCEHIEVGYGRTVLRNWDESVDVEALIADADEDAEEVLDLHWVYGVPCSENPVLSYWLQNGGEDSLIMD